MTSPFSILEPKDGFLGLPPELAVSYEEAGAVIIPFGLEASVSYGSGTENGPAAMQGRFKIVATV